MKKAAIILLLLFSCNMYGGNIFYKGKIFATFNLTVRNNFTDELKIKCLSLSKGKHQVHFYGEYEWDMDHTEYVTVFPGKSETFNVGVFCSVESVLWVTTSKYLSEKAMFSVIVIPISEGQEEKNGIELVWAGSGKDKNDIEQYTPFYYYSYTGFFEYKGAEYITEKQSVRPSFNIYGIADFKSKKYNNDKIITSNNLWDQRSGSYILDIVPNDTKFNFRKEPFTLFNNDSHIYTEITRNEE